MIQNLTSSHTELLLPLMTDLGYPDQEFGKLKTRMTEFLSHTNCFLYGYFENERLLGFASLTLIPLIHEDGNLARISALAVAVSAQGQGIGKKLMAHLESVAKSKNSIRVELTSGAHRENGAHKFYSKIGYEKSTGARFVKKL